MADIQASLLTYVTTAAGSQAKGLFSQDPTLNVAKQAQQAPQGGQGDKKVPPKDERSWLQKNWIFLLPLGLVVSISATSNLLPSDA